MSKITQSARGKSCTVQSPWCMDQYPHESTVAAHAPAGFGRGMALKAPDWAIAYACYRCHDVLDGRSHINDTTKQERMEMWLRGFYKTMCLLIDAGLVVIP
jgi:hypothetical protein